MFGRGVGETEARERETKREKNTRKTNKQTDKITLQAREDTDNGVAVAENNVFTTHFPNILIAMVMVLLSQIVFSSPKGILKLVFFSVHFHHNIP